MNDSDVWRRVNTLVMGRELVLRRNSRRRRSLSHRRSDGSRTRGKRVVDTLR